MRLLLHYTGLAALVLGVLAGCSTTPVPPASFGPVPKALQLEIDSFYAALDRDILNRDLNRVLEHYTATAEYSYRAYYPAFNDHQLLHRNFSEIQWYYQINLTALEADSIMELRKGFEYLPGIAPGDFTIRYQSYPRFSRTEFPKEPFAEVTVKFRRTGGTLQIHSVAAQNLRAPDPPRPNAATAR